ncbi:glycoside hydrolase subgroup catalytic core [Brachionus plicatilis]|uniref:Glycoside hydrolase subgroup catalytic core n=1 Tax=Brachionus plicatilis TaxID=10195 RepID=A0A3M7QSF0_BRAPC|nr:glycoside hydrolase subgroup catalytic core [Brachionus plicatilis]
MGRRIISKLQDFFLLKILFLALAYVTSGSQSPLSKIRINDKWFVDEKNRVVLFHGINAIRKEFPWIPDKKELNMTNNTQLLNLKKWGFNTVRLGVMWSGLMPEKNLINQAYLDQMIKIVDQLALFDFYVIIDLHQDMMSSKLLLGHSYELLNEPWAGNVYSNPLLLLPGIAGSKNLLKLYDRTYETIRKYDKSTLIFYEPVTWGVLLNRNYFGTGFKRPPGYDYQTTVFSWHYYCWFLNFKENPLINGTYPELDKIICDNIQLKISFESVKLDMLELGGGPSFLTEFGECAFRKDDNEFNLDECKAILDQSDKNFQSWCYWDSYFYDLDSLNEISELVSLFSRVYPKATNGIPIRYFFNSTSKEFSYEYRMNITNFDQAMAPTEIHIPPEIYPNGFYFS